MLDSEFKTLELLWHEMPKQNSNSSTHYLRSRLIFFNCDSVPLKVNQLVHYCHTLRCLIQGVLIARVRKSLAVKKFRV